MRKRKKHFVSTLLGDVFAVVSFVRFHLHSLLLHPILPSYFVKKNVFPPNLTFRQIYMPELYSYNKRSDGICTLE